MPEMGWPNDGAGINDRLGSPDFKAWLQSQRGGRGGPGMGPGGGFGSFAGGGGMATGFNAFGGGSTPAIRRYQFGGAQAVPQLQMGGMNMQNAVPDMGGMTYSMPQTQAQTMTGLRQGASAAPATSSNGFSGMIQRLQQQAAQQAAAAQSQSPSNNNQPLNWQQAGANTDPGWAGTFWRTLAPFGQGGAFGPMGNPAITEEIMRQTGLLGQGAAARARNQAQLSGLDPAAAASYGLQASLQGQRDTANAGASALLPQLMGGQDWARSILGAYLGANTQAGATDSINRYRMDAQNQGGSGFGGVLSGLGGQFIGSLMPTVGW